MAFLVSVRTVCSQLSEILDYLFLSGIQAVRADRIRQKKITCIINATIDEPNLYIKGIDYLKVRVDDNPFVKLDAYFDVVADRIKQTRDAGGKCLVHCVAGVSRSASLILAYLMKHERMTLRQAFYHVKAVRPIIRPNGGFWKQLVEYERRLFSTNTVKLETSKFGDVVPDVYTEELKRGWTAQHPLSARNNPSVKEKESHSEHARSATPTDKYASLGSSPRRPSIGSYYRRSMTPPASKRSPLLFTSASASKLRHNGLLTSLYYSNDFLFPKF